MKLAALLVAFGICAAAAAPARAAGANEVEAGLRLGVGVANVGGEHPWGPAGGLDVAYGITDAWAVSATLQGSTGSVSADKALAQASRRISTGELNKLLEQIVAHKPPPAGRGGRHVRLYYATQASVRPPTFYLSTNHPAEVGSPYRRFLINRLREAYGFEGTPVRLVLRAHRQKKAAPPAAVAAAARRPTRSARSSRK